MKKKKIILTTLFLICFLSCFACAIRYNFFLKIGNKINQYELIQKNSEEYLYRHENLSICDKIEPMVDEEGAWYTKYHFISHAGGGIDGKTYTNSTQSWELSYKRGNRLFDADLAFTTDNILVLRHGWNDNLEQNISMSEGKSPYIDSNGQIRYIDFSSGRMDYNTFINTKIYKKLDPMSCVDMLNFMNEHEDVYVMCDMKDDLEESYQYLVKTAIDNDMAKVLDRIVISIYNYNDLKQINMVYNFKEIMIRQYINSPHKYSELLQFCKENNIHAIGISACYVDDEGISQLSSHNIHIYVAICDFISDMERYYQLGIEGAISNWLYEDDWNYINPNTKKGARAH